MEYIAYFDIEGSAEDAVEVGIVISDDKDNGMIDAACFHAIPDNKLKFQKESIHCHGLNLSNLKQISTCQTSQSELYNEVIKFLYKYNVKTIVGHDGANSTCSDNVEFLRRVGYSGYQYVNKPALPIWADRDYEIYHCTALHFKKHKLPLVGVSCAANHSDSIQIIHGMMRTINAKSRAGGHCALYDSFELFLFHGGML